MHAGQRHQGRGGAVRQGAHARHLLRDPRPDTDDVEVDESGLRHNVRHCLDVLGSAGIYVHGFYGNYWLLTAQEHHRDTEFVADEVGDEALAISRSGRVSLKEAIEPTVHAASVGADIISTIGPVFGGGSESSVIDYLEALARHTRRPALVCFTRPR